MKRFLSILLSALLIVSSIATVTFAEAKPTFTIGNVEVKPGETVDLYVTASNFGEVKAIALDVISYGEGLSITATEVLVTGFTSLSVEDIEPNLSLMTNKNKPVADGAILKITFKAAEDAALGKRDVTYRGASLKKLNGEKEEAVECDLVAGSVTVVGKNFTTAPKFEGELNPTYNGEAHKLTVVGDEILTTEIPEVYYEGIDGTVYAKTTEAPVNAGTYKVTSTVAPAGYTPVELEATLTINKADYPADAVTVKTSQTATYNGVIQTIEAPEIKADYTSKITPEISYSADAKDAGTYTVTITYTSNDANYNAPEADTVEFVIEKAQLVVTAQPKTIKQNSDMSTLELGYDVTGLKGGDTKEVVLNDGKLEVENCDGTVLGNDFNITQGTLALVSSNYTLEYVGTKLSVVDKDPVNFDVTIAQDKVYNGVAIEAPIVSNYDQTLVEPITTEYTYTGVTAAGETYNSTEAPKEAGEYTVSVLVYDANYKGTKTAMFKIAKATIDMSGVTIAPATFGYTAQNKKVTIPALPDGVSVDKVTYVLDADTKVEVTGDVAATFTKVGTYAVTVSYKITDELAKNWEVPENDTATLTINAVAPTKPVITTSVGSKEITVTVTSPENGATTTATITVTKEGADPITGGGTLENGKYTETFTDLENGTEYTIAASVNNGIGEPADVEADSVIATPKASQNTSTPIKPSDKLPSGNLGSVTDSNKPSTEEPGTEEPGTEEPGTDEPGTEEPGTDEPGTEEPEIEIVVDPDEEVAVINPAEAVEKDAETGAIVWENTYEDVKADEWYADAVGFAKTTGLMNGVGETSFAPDATLTRGMFATILYRLVEAPEAAQKVGFKDVADDAWYADAINWGAKNGIVSGVGGGNFAPDDVVTREQMATMLYRFATLMGHEAEAAALGFADAEHVADWAEEAFAWCTANGIINGVSDTELAPQETATRAQAAAVFMRTVEFFNK